MKLMNQSRRGFTLIEIMVSVSIMVILTIIGVVSYSQINKRSRDVKRKGDIEQIRSALEMYRSDDVGYPAGNYPNWGIASDYLGILVGTYIPAIPTDPQQSSWNYYYIATNMDDNKYYGYCVCGMLETINALSSTCSVSYGTYNYCLKSP